MPTVASTTDECVRVGHVRIPITTAEAWIREYTDAERNMFARNPYAYPAYDDYERETNDPLRITDADLLAPALLNVTPTIRGFYGLQRIRKTLESALANKNLARPLADISDRAQIGEMVKPLYAVLDDDTLKPPGIRATTLSKVLHRKRPDSIVLHDKWVRACYVGDGRPVPRAERRSWADYMTAVTIAIGEDIRDQPAAFVQLSGATQSPGSLTHVRLLDILAWKSQGTDRASKSQAPSGGRR